MILIFNVCKSKKYVLDTLLNHECERDVSFF
jgi:hypothetical protein